MHTQTPCPNTNSASGEVVGGIDHHHHYNHHNNNNNNNHHNCHSEQQRGTGQVVTMDGHITSHHNTHKPKHDVIAMVGLPARGKTFISRNIVKYLNDRGYECRIFNVGEYRRLSTDYTTHDFFASDNEYALQMRNKLAMDALEDLCSWLAKGDNRVAIYDATNSTMDRRAVIYDTVACKYNYNLLFIESICNKSNILEMNIKHKTNSPDYSRFDHDYAIKDFKQRIAHYETRYKPLGVYAEEENYTFIQILNAGEDWHFHHCRSGIQLMLVHYLVDLYTSAPITTRQPQQQQQQQQQQVNQHHQRHHSSYSIRSTPNPIEATSM